ncbi:MAG TPA: hypothetical protein VKU19_34880 [Bryobacteraceae bacterium]|nr:hypothetical protein [Bryobacteraceae bacterium]
MQEDVRALVKAIQGVRGPRRDRAIASLFKIGERVGSQYDVAAACLSLRQRGDLSLAEISEYTAAALKYWSAIEARVEPLQQAGPDTEWMLEDEYLEPRAEAEVVLDLLGYLDMDGVRSVLERAIHLADPRLKCFTVVSLLRLQQVVDPDEIERVAESHEMRMTFMNLLRELDMHWLMPEPWSRPDLLAASDLVHWASHPNELGVPPEEIELMQIFLVGDEGEEPEEVYLFRFREYPRPWAPGEGWMAGIAGPVRDGRRQGSPWSSFKQWDSMTPEEHFEKLYYRGSCCG